MRKGIRSNLKSLGLAALVLGASFSRAERVTNTIENITNDVSKEVVWMPSVFYGISAGANGSVNGTASDWYDEGTSVSNNAVANQHYVFGGWQNAPTGLENDNPLVFELSDDVLDEFYAPTNIVATFDLTDYNVALDSKYTNWFGETTIGSPEGAGSYQAFSSPEISVDRYVPHPTNPGRRLRFVEFKDQD